MTTQDHAPPTTLGQLARIVMWAAIAGLLALPAIAMRFTGEVDWSLSDFVVMGMLLGGAGLAVEFLARRKRDVTYRLGGALAVLGGLLLVWVDLAVGIVGDTFDPGNLLFVAVLAVGAVGAVSARFEPGGMARAMLATVAALVVATVAAFVIAAGSEGATWPLAMLGTAGILSTIWVAAAALFARSARN